VDVMVLVKRKRERRAVLLRPGVVVENGEKGR
jgi:hypothetical protein